MQKRSIRKKTKRIAQIEVIADHGKAITFLVNHKNMKYPD